MQDVVVGDVLFDENGTPCHVVYVSPIWDDHECFEVIFSDGEKITADANHEWMTTNRRTRKALVRRNGKKSDKPQCQPRYSPSIVTTKMIAETLIDSGEANHSIECANPLECQSKDLLIDPYVLGAWLGDGNSKGAEITCSDLDAEILEQIEAAGYSILKYGASNDKTPRYGIGRGNKWHDENSFRLKLDKLGVLNNKHIPSDYLRSSKAQRLALIQGLMDTDGYIEPNGNCEFTTTRKAIADGFYELCVSLGIKAGVSIGKATLYEKDCGEKYRIGFTPYIPVFRLGRKLAMIKAPGKQAKRQGRRYIVDVVPIKSVPARCIQVDSPSHLYLASRSMIPTHNTRTINEWAITQALPGTRGAIVAATAADARDIMIEGESGMLNVSRDRPTYEPSKRRLTWPNGAMATTFSADEPDRLRGPQFHWAVCDELAAWRFPMAFDMLMLGLRLGNDPRCAIATTPRPTEIIRKLVASPQTIVTRGNTYENRANLAEAFFSQIIGQYEGTRLGRQEINAEILDDVPGALWTRTMLDSGRVTQAPQLTRIVVAVDPEATATETSAETGIIVAGLGVDKQGYVLDDRTIRAAPATWASQAVAAYHSRRADRIVYESNQGGDMVAHTLQTIERDVPLKGVHASRGKQARAEPIAALYEQGRVHHVGVFTDLEDQLCNWTPTNGQASPDRLDALVWALTELMVGAQTWVRKPQGLK